MTSTTLLNIVLQDKSWPDKLAVTQIPLLSPDHVVEQVYGLAAALIMRRDGRVLEKGEFESRFNYWAAWAGE